MQLAVTIVGKNRPALIVELTRTIKECQCNIVESRMSELAGEFASYLLVEGNWNHVAKFESIVEIFASRLKLKVNFRRIQETETPHRDLTPYGVDIVTMDRKGILYDLASFFSDHSILIHDLSSSCYEAAYTDTPMLSAHIVIKIPPELRIVSFRDEFLDFCDRLNIDAILEPVKRF